MAIVLALFGCLVVWFLVLFIRELLIARKKASISDVPQKEIERRLTRRTVRPKTFDDFFGHDDEVEILKRAKAAAQRNTEILRPILLVGKAGTGKTTMARIVADGGRMIEMSGATMKEKDIVEAINELGADTIFIDEIHRAKKRTQEFLYPLLEDGILVWDNKKIQTGVNFIAATTDVHTLTKPLRDRFSITLYIQPYSDREMNTIIKNIAHGLDMDITEEAAILATRYVRGTARWAVRLLEMARDYLNESKTIQVTEISEAIKRMGFSESGLLNNEKEYLRTLRDLGGIAGLSTLAASLQVDVEMVREVESWLLENNYIIITHRGRKITPKGDIVAREP
jgi:Holliday junction DNA helicase RuvB